MNTRDRRGLEVVEFRADGRTPATLRVIEPEPAQYSVGPAQNIQLPAARTPGVTAHVEGSYQDRARGFSISTLGLSTVVALSAAGITWVVGGAFGAAVVLALLAGYLLTWLAAFLLHTLVSAEGSELIRTVGEYRLLAREQRERHARMRRERGD